MARDDSVKIAVFFTAYAGNKSSPYGYSLNNEKLRIYGVDIKIKNTIMIHGSNKINHNINLIKIF